MKETNTNSEPKEGVESHDKGKIKLSTFCLSFKKFQ
jgi:hypothetical protein